MAFPAAAGPAVHCIFCWRRHREERGTRVPQKNAASITNAAHRDSFFSKSYKNKKSPPYNDEDS